MRSVTWLARLEGRAKSDPGLSRQRDHGATVYRHSLGCLDLHISPGSHVNSCCAVHTSNTCSSHHDVAANRPELSCSLANQVQCVASYADILLRLQTYFSRGYGHGCRAGQSDGTRICPGANCSIARRLRISRQEFAVSVEAATGGGSPDVWVRAVALREGVHTFASRCMTRASCRRNLDITRRRDLDVPCFGNNFDLRGRHVHIRARAYDNISCWTHIERPHIADTVASRVSEND